MESTTTTAPLNTCQHCGGTVEYGMTEHGYKGFVHIANGLSACPTPEEPTTEASEQASEQATEAPATVVRTWNADRTKATLTVTLAGGDTWTMGGQRAARAAAVIIGKTLPSEAAPEGTVGHWGVRGDMAAAQAEARGLAEGRTRRVRSQVRGQRARLVDVPPVAQWAVAVPVAEAVAP